MRYRYYEYTFYTYYTKPEFKSFWRTDGKIVEYYNNINKQWYKQNYKVGILRNKTLFMEVREADVMLEIL